MNTTLIIYIWGLLDSLRGCLYAAAVIPSLAFVALVILTLGDVLEFLKGQPQLAARLTRAGIWITAIALVAATLLPSSKTFAAMVIVPHVIESDVIRKDMPELYEAAKARLMESLKETKAEASK